MSRTVLVVAGEASGDQNAAALVQAALARNPDLRFFGIGGDHLRSRGMEILFDSADLSVFGLPSVLRRLPYFRGVFRRMVREARERRPDAALLVDYGGFNLRFAARLKSLGIKVIYYVCPQVWASRRERIRKLARCVDRLMVIFPFEPALFAGTGLRVDFVGHPLVDALGRTSPGPPTVLPWKSARRVALLPGSRTQEIDHIFPVMWKAAVLLAAREPEASFLVAAASSPLAVRIRAHIDAIGERPARYDVVTGQTREILRQASAAWVASGTATVEAALMGCPMAVVYKTNWPFYLMARCLVRIPYIGMVNVIAGREICPEFIQQRATPARLAGALHPLLEDGPARREMRAGLEEVRSALGRGGGAENAAAILLEELGLS